MHGPLSAWYQPEIRVARSKMHWFSQLRASRSNALPVHVCVAWYCLLSLFIAILLCITGYLFTVPFIAANDDGWQSP